MKPLLFVSWIIIGFIQLAAMVQGFQKLFGSIVGFILSFFLGQMPVIGTVIGTMGAINNWHWAWWQAILLFFGAPILVTLLYALNDKK